MLTADDLFAKIAEEGFLIDSLRQTPSPSQEHWQVNLRRQNKDKSFGYYAGHGPTLRDALQQAAGNGGAITGRRSMEKDDKPKRRSREDLLG